MTIVGLALKHSFMSSPKLIAIQKYIRKIQFVNLKISQFKVQRAFEKTNKEQSHCTMSFCGGKVNLHSEPKFIKSLLIFQAQDRPLNMMLG